MAMTRLELLKDRLRRYLIAEAAILRGEEYQLDARRLRRPDLSKVRQAISDLQAEIDMLERRGGRVKQIVFMD